MRGYRKNILLTLMLLLLVSAGALYQPIKENHIYQKNLNLSEENEIKETTSDDDKMIQKAKSSFKDLVSTNLNDDDYDIQVFWEDKDLEENAVTVSFYDKEYGGIMYSVSYSTTTGKVLNLYQAYEPVINQELLSEQKLKKIAKDLVYKITELKASDITCEGTFNWRNKYSVDINVKGTKHTINVYLNGYSGMVESYIYN